MAEKKILRTSFIGGFNKQDVLSFIDELKNKVSESENKIKEQEEKIKTLDKKLTKVPALEENLNILKNDLTKQKIENKILLEKSETLSLKNIELSEENKKYLSERSELDNYKNELKANEAKLGAAFLDARRYSATLVEAADNEIKKTTDETVLRINEQSVKIENISKDIEEINKRFNISLNALKSDIEKLSSEMNSSAVKLRSQHIKTDFNPDVVIDVEKKQSKNKSTSILKFGKAFEG
ncbi:MAG: hypothetical protein ACTTK5_00725 [Candidatus Fimenecus sp.]